MNGFGLDSPSLIDFYSALCEYYSQRPETADQQNILLKWLRSPAMLSPRHWIFEISPMRIADVPESLKIASSPPHTCYSDLVGNRLPGNLRTMNFTRKLMNTIHVYLNSAKGKHVWTRTMSGQTVHTIKDWRRRTGMCLRNTNRSHLERAFPGKSFGGIPHFLITGKEDMIVSASSVNLSQTVPAITRCRTGCMRETVMPLSSSYRPMQLPSQQPENFSTAGERAEKNSSGFGSFQTKLFDQFTIFYKVPVRQYQPKLLPILSWELYTIIFHTAHLFPSSLATPQLPAQKCRCICDRSYIRFLHHSIN